MEGMGEIVNCASPYSEIYRHLNTDVGLRIEAKSPFIHFNSRDILLTREVLRFAGSTIQVISLWPPTWGSGPLNRRNQTPGAGAAP